MGKNESILDMRATAYAQHPSHVIHMNDQIALLNIKERAEESRKEDKGSTAL